jgi:hypothetical protein
MQQNVGGYLLEKVSQKEEEQGDRLLKSSKA